jgi:hypothetical protein
MGSCRKTCVRACWLNLAAHPAQDESAVSLRICSRDIPVHLLSDLPPERRPLQKKNWRRGQESNLPRLLRTDNGFEDREGHQAPVTLREEGNVQPASAVDGLRRGERPISNIQHPTV